ncbi:hypothetical protein Rt10032_c01g0367 [Rhodotorula toruloides]|uniref:Uncharacterized protein n=1 Tax=Rhodotorula toruloides TaxID=5286 RepID=A0A511K7N9_RHOTO|nr:hypothetical protein Rt10032_c01g0367 [Rhodotorula toruloides]
MSTSRAPAPKSPQPIPADSAPPPPSASTASPVPVPTRKAAKTSPSGRRKPLRRRGARVESESEEESPVATAGDARDGTDSDSDFDPPSPDSADEDDDEDDEDAIEGAPEPKTPAAASVEQLAPVAHGDRKATVLTSQLAHPSWSDMPAPGEGGAEDLPTLDFANLSIDAVQALPSPPASVKAPAKKATVAPAAAKEEKSQLSKKQLLLQKREAKSAALKAKDPEAWTAKEKERLEKEEAKKAARKERVKEKRKEKKLTEKEKAEKAAAVEGTGEAQALAPAATTTPAVALAQPAKSTRPLKSVRPVVPSRPSRTALALGLVNSTPASPSAPSTLAAAPKAESKPSGPAVPFASASETTPIVPLATRLPAFVQRDQDGRPIPRSSFFGDPPRRRRSLGKEDPFASFWRGSGRGEAVGRGRGRAGSDAFVSSRGRGRGRGVMSARGVMSGRGGTATGPPGAINPRYAHLPFHPLHRFPSPAPFSSAQSTSKEPVAPEATTAVPDESLFERPEQGQDEVTSVKLPGKQQVSLAVKGSAAKAADAEAAEAKTREAEEHAKKLAAEHAVAEDLERRRQQGASVLYAADPTRFASPPIEPVTQPAVSMPSYEQRPPDAALHSSMLYQVPPHLRSSAAAAQQAAYVHRQESPAYYAPQPYYSPEAFPLVPSPPVPTPPPTFLPTAHAPPSSTYFLPPRANKRVEIKAPSRDGQSPVPVKTVSSPSTDALTAAQRARIEALQQEEDQRRLQYGDAASSVGAVAGSSSPVSTRAPFPPSPQQQRQHLAFSPPAFSPVSAFYPVASPMYTPYAQQPPPPQAFDPSSHPAHADQYGFYSPPPTQHHHHQQAYAVQHSFQPSMSSPPGTTFYHQPHLADVGVMSPSGYYAFPNQSTHFPQQHDWPMH